MPYLFDGERRSWIPLSPRSTEECRVHEPVVKCIQKFDGRYLVGRKHRLDVVVSSSPPAEISLAQRVVVDRNNGVFEYFDDDQGLSNRRYWLFAGGEFHAFAFAGAAVHRATLSPDGTVMSILLRSFRVPDVGEDGIARTDHWGNVELKELQPPEWCLFAVDVEDW